MSSVSSFGSSLDSAGAHALMAGATTHGAGGAGVVAPGGVSGRSWFQGWGDEASAPASLHAEVEPQARGLSASQHAERVLAHLVDSVA